MVTRKGGKSAMATLVERISRYLCADLPVYFAHAHSPWERGTNENTNGLIRNISRKGHKFLGHEIRGMKYLRAIMTNLTISRMVYSDLGN